MSYPWTPSNSCQGVKIRANNASPKTADRADRAIEQTPHLTIPALQRNNTKSSIHCRCKNGYRQAHHLPSILNRPVAQSRYLPVFYSREQHIPDRSVRLLMRWPSAVIRHQQPEGGLDIQSPAVTNRPPCSQRRCSKIVLRPGVCRRRPNRPTCSALLPGTMRLPVQW